jgi:hypothetical protein
VSKYHSLLIAINILKFVTKTYIRQEQHEQLANDLQLQIGGMNPLNFDLSCVIFMT